jgi:hypothetical protein
VKRLQQIGEFLLQLIEIGMYILALFPEGEL